MADPKLWALIIEDDRAVELVTRSMLEFLGYEVTSVTTLEEGMRNLAEMKQLDLVVSDLSAAEHHLTELLTACHEHHPTARRLITSGRSLTPEEECSPHFEGTGFLLKPFDLAALRSFLDR